MRRKGRRVASLPGYYPWKDTPFEEMSSWVTLGNGIRGAGGDKILRGCRGGSSSCRTS